MTSRLVERFGPNRVINTLLDETSILGLGIGMAHNGILPIPEINFLLMCITPKIKFEEKRRHFPSSPMDSSPILW